MTHLQEVGIAIALVAAAQVVAAPVPVQSYPAKPVRIVAAGPGTSSDFLSRILGPRLSGRWGQPVVVDNRGGGAGTISPSLVAKATPDGYTLLMGGASELSNAIHLQKTTYNPVTDFAPVILVAKAPQVIVAHASVPAGNLRDFIAYAKKRPRAMSYAAGGASSVSSLTTALLCITAGIDLVQVPYRGVSAALMAIVSGEAQFGSIAATVAVPQIRAGKVKAYAVTSRLRFAVLPDVPTAIEAGLPGFESTAWFGVLAPARTPVAILNTLNRDIDDILRAPDTVQAIHARGAEVVPGSPEAFAAFIRSEILKWGRVIKVTGARI